MKYRMLGKTELEVSEVGFGVWTVSTRWWERTDERDDITLLDEALDLGINFFDTGDIYGLGYGEEILAKALGKKRNDILIGTKFGYDFYTNVGREGYMERPQDFSPAFVRYACEQSLRRLNTDHIDLYQLHNPRLEAIESD
ncbi:MAG: aldo/keto reductase, partial [Dehalococcoidia bacterium]|nr:aldo/keto reductase [Dehalococcoidia bacterium]